VSKNNPQSVYFQDSEVKKKKVSNIVVNEVYLNLMDHKKINQARKVLNEKRMTDDLTCKKITRFKVKNGFQLSFKEESQTKIIN